MASQPTPNLVPALTNPHPRLNSEQKFDPIHHELSFLFNNSPSFQDTVTQNFIDPTQALLTTPSHDCPTSLPAPQFLETNPFQTANQPLQQNFQTFIPHLQHTIYPQPCSFQIPNSQNPHNPDLLSLQPFIIPTNYQTTCAPHSHHYPQPVQHSQQLDPSLCNFVYDSSPSHANQTNNMVYSNNQPFKPPKQNLMKPNHLIRKERTNHRNRHLHRSSSVRCQKCPELFENQVNAERHLRGCHPNIPHLFRCSHCTASYEAKGARTIHQRKAHPGTFHQSQIMNQFCVNKSAKRFACYMSNCSKSYSAASNLKRHIEMAHLGKRYPCRHCDYSATTKPNLKVHENRMHDSSRE